MEDIIIIENIIKQFEGRSNAEAINSICEDKELVALMVGYILGIEKTSNRRKTVTNPKLKNIEKSMDNINQLFNK